MPQLFGEKGSKEGADSAEVDKVGSIANHMDFLRAPPDSITRRAVAAAAA